MTLLTKSKYMVGLQCDQYLWYTFNDKSFISEPDEAQLFVMKQGTEVGELATKLFKGIKVPEAFKENIEKTKELLKEKKTLFEAGFMIDNLYCRVDILEPVKDKWNIIEVKSTTKVKDEHYPDISFQKHVLEKCGLKINKCYLMHLNNKYVREGELDLKQLFFKEDVTNQVNVEGIPERIAAMFEIIAQKEAPDITIGEHCKKPYDCPVTTHCWKHLPDENVMELMRGGKKSYFLYEDGIHLIKDIPDDFKLTSNQEIQKKCSLTGEVHVHKDGIKQFLNTLQVPLYYLDFETICTAVPLFDGVKSYQQVPFQWSLHADKHYEFLASGDGDPRPQFLEQLKKVLGDHGTIVTYNMAFEIGVLRKCADQFPEHKEWVESVVTRFVDLWVPFRNFSYYNPKQKGSASIKKVLPALTGKDYSGLDIADGTAASRAFLKILNNEADETEKLKLRKDLLKYCKMDTEAMVWVVDELKGLVE